MKILLVLENITEICGANVNIANSLARYWRKNDEVWVLSGHDELTPIRNDVNEIYDGVFSFYSNQSSIVKTIRKKWFLCDNNFEKLKILCKNPFSFIKVIDTKYLNSTISMKIYLKKIEELYKEVNFDIIIGVVEPYYIARAISKAKINTKKILLQLDPYTYNYSHSIYMQNYRKQIENNVNQTMDKLFIVNYLEGELTKRILHNKNNNLLQVELPAMTFNKNIVQDSIIVKEKGDIHFIFLGSFYKDIRNPKFMFELFLNLPKNFILHIVGGNCEKIIEEYSLKIGKRFIYHGWIPKREADQLMYLSLIHI